MFASPRKTVQLITTLHRDTVARWHHEPVDNPFTGLFQVVCQQHQYNFQLWHEEDIARSPTATDSEIAAVKRRIDGLNQSRNNWIERLDEYLLEKMDAAGIAAEADAAWNTETPGSAIDRLSIMALRIYHLMEQLERTDVDRDHVEGVEEKLHRCYAQHGDLSAALALLLEDIFAGRKALKVYRQMKMYNDPALNPHLYGRRKAG